MKSECAVRSRCFCHRLSCLVQFAPFALVSADCIDVFTELVTMVLLTISPVTTYLTQHRCTVDVSVFIFHLYALINDHVVVGISASLSGVANMVLLFLLWHPVSSRVRNFLLIIMFISKHCVAHSLVCK